MKIKIESQLRRLVCADSLASIETEGVVGNTYLLIKGGSAQAQHADDLATLRSKEPFDLSAVIEQGTGVINDAGKTIRDADQIIQQLGETLQGTLGKIGTTVGNVNDVVVGQRSSNSSRTVGDTSLGYRGRVAPGHHTSEG